MGRAKPYDYEDESPTTIVFDTNHGQYLVQVFPDGQAHLAWRRRSPETWSAGVWTITR